MTRLVFLTLVLAVISCGPSSKSENKDQEELDVNMDQSSGEEESSTFYVATISGMNLREEPSTSGKKIRLLTGGSEVKLLEKTGLQETISGFEGEWFKVDIGGEIGYVFSGYLSRFELPKPNEKNKMEWFFNENFIRDGNEVVLKMTWGEDGNTRSGTPVKSRASIQIMEESDFFEIRQSYLRGSYYIEDMGYEYSGQRGFIPGISIQEAFLLSRWLIAKLESGPCKYELKDIPFSKSNTTIKTSSDCSLEIVVEKRGDEVQKMVINAADDFLYKGLEFIVQKGGVEFKVYTAL
jgi:hypothetical protein